MSASIFRSSESSENERALDLGPSSRYFSPGQGIGAGEWRRDLKSEIEIQLRNHRFSWLPIQWSVVRQEYRVALYERLGSGRSSWEWVRDLYAYLNEQSSLPARGLTFFAVFPDAALSSYREFTLAFAREMQFLLLGDALEGDRFAQMSALSVQARIRLESGSVTMLGLHPDHPDLARRFPVPVIVISEKDFPTP